MENSFAPPPNPLLLLRSLEEAALTLNPTTLFRTIAFSFFAISNLPGAYFYQHERDELPRIRGDNISIWIDWSGKFAVYFVQRDEIEWTEEVESEVIFLNGDTLVSGDTVYVTNNHVNAVEVFKRLRDIVLSEAKRGHNLKNVPVLAGKKPNMKLANIA